MKTRGQTAIEYVMIIGGAIMFVVIVVLIIRSGTIAQVQTQIMNNSGEYIDTYARSYLFWDKFDSPSATNDKWSVQSGMPGTWTVANGKYSITAGPGAAFSRSIMNDFIMELQASVPVDGGSFSAKIRSNRKHDQYYEVKVATSGGTYSTITLSKTAAAPGLPMVYNIPVGIPRTYIAALKVQAIGPKIDVYFNNAATAAISYTDPAPLLSGLNGIASDSAADFEYVRIWDPNS